MYASWEVVSYCNLACSHCYSTYNEEGFRVPAGRRLSSEKMLAGLTSMKEAGITQINLEGGEPTLMGEDLVEAVRVSASLGMRPIVSTHGMFLLKNGLALRLADAGLSAMSLSLDGATASVNNAIRVTHGGAPSDHFERVKDFLAWYGRECERGKAPFALKINVVIRRDNIEDLRNITHVVRDIPEGSPVQIKLVQFQPRGAGKEVAHKLSVTQHEFFELVQHVTCASRFPVVFRKYDEEEEYPFFVFRFDGGVVIPKGKLHEPVMVDGAELNVFDEEFPKNFRKYSAGRPEFQHGNKRINTYAR